MTADLERARREEADRIVAGLDRSLRAADDAAASVAKREKRPDRLDHWARFGASGAENHGPLANLKSAANSQKSRTLGELKIAAPDRTLSVSASSVANLNGLEGKLRRRCPSILASSSEYDEDLVSLCQTWVAGR